jgi:histone acetyltransferase MYST1
MTQARKKGNKANTKNTKGVKAGGPKGKGTGLQKSGSNQDLEDEGEPKDIDDHPFECGHSLVVEYRDGSKRLAKIIERTQNKEKERLKAPIEEQWKYYVHYHDFNRRMDEWINNARITKFPSEANLIEEKMKEEEEEAKRQAADEEARRKQQEVEEGAGKGVPLIVGTGIHGAGFGRGGPAHLGRGSSLTLLADYDDNDDNDEEEDEDGNAVQITTQWDDEHDEHEGMDHAAMADHEEVTKVKNIATVLFGRYNMECWYFSPYPKELFIDCPVLDTLYVCEFTFRFFRTKDELIRYHSKPGLPRHPPGNEIYRDEHVSMFELDGAVEKIYCQNLCYFAKLFLDHKTLQWDVDPFLFYVLARRDDRGFHPVGFFSKEKYSDVGYNLACILTFPCEQRRGYGRFLIAFSYELSKKEDKVGSPEKPLSDLGAVSYRSYWSTSVLQAIQSYDGKDVSVMDLCKITSIVSDDLLATLHHLKLLHSIGDNYIITAPPDVIEGLLKTYPNKGLQVDPQNLHWAPLYICEPKKDKWSIKSKKPGLVFD